MEDYLKNLFTPALQFAYTVSHWMGEQIVGMIWMLFPGATLLDQIIDPVGVLAILTVLLLVVQVARRMAWVVVAAGWLLISVRVAILLFDQSS